MAVNSSPGPSGDTIVLSAGTYVLSLGELPAITNSSVDLTISGAGARSTTISGNDASGIFSIQAGTVAMSGVTLARAFNNDTSGTNASTFGGAIHNDGSLTLTDVAVTDSVYEGNGGGGGIFTTGPLTLDRVTVSQNSASGDGGGIYFIPLQGSKTVSLIDSTIAGNTVNGSLAGGSPQAEVGGGLEMDGGTLQLTNTTIADNTLEHGASGTGGGVALETSRTSRITRSPRC